MEALYKDLGPFHTMLQWFVLAVMFALMLSRSQSIKQSNYAKATPNQGGFFDVAYMLLSLWACTAYAVIGRQMQPAAAGAEASADAAGAGAAAAGAAWPPLCDKPQT